MSYRAAVSTRRRRRAEQAVILAIGGGAVLAVAAPAVRVLVALAAVGLAWVMRPADDPERWLRGADGEAATAMLLSRLGRRYAVFHDRAVPGSAANLDHVVIGPSGVWVVDSKAYRGRLVPGWRSVRAGQHRVDTSAAAWEASIVADRLACAARPLLAVHAEGLPRRGRRVGGVPVLPAGRVVRRMRRRRGSMRLGATDVEVLAAQFDRTFPPATGRARPAHDRARR